MSSPFTGLEQPRQLPRVFENDSDATYLREEGENELDHLRDILSGLGVEQSEIDKAIKEADWQT